MKVTTRDIINGFADYLVKELRPQYPSETLGSFMMGFSSGLIRKRADAMAKKITSNPLVSAFIMEDGKVDLDEVLEAAQEAVPEYGLTVAIPLSGEVTFQKSDAALIKQYIERASG